MRMRTIRRRPPIAPTISIAASAGIAIAAAIAIATLTAALPTTAEAHGFGERYDLPLPLSLFIIAGAAAVLLSFAVAALFLRAGAPADAYPRCNLLRTPPGRWLASRWVTTTAQTLSVLLTVYVIFGALAGSERAALNPAPAAVYVAFWVGLSFFTALAGNLWALVNPWAAVWRLAETLAPALRRRRPYPQRWAQWPALLAFLAFAILETVAADAAGPRALGWILLAYTAYNLAGMYWFGRAAWLRNGEAFSLVFRFMAQFSITEIRVRNAAAAVTVTAGTPPERRRRPRRRPSSLCAACPSGDCPGADPSAGDCVDCPECYAAASPEQREFNLRPPCVGLNRPGRITPAAGALVILLLATVSFDGLSATPEWLTISTQFILLTPTLGGYLANLLGVIGMTAVFALLYAAACALMRMASRQPTPATPALMGGFILSLLPIALAYHYAHFIGFLLVNGQRFIVLASDPFGWGWNLFGTADAVINIGIVSPVFIWYFSIAAIVAGHIAGVWLAHARATAEYAAPNGGRRAALFSQLPMLALMVCYTGVSLWIISRPIAE